jgi:predicted nucleic acid-binding protein
MYVFDSDAYTRFQQGDSKITVRSLAAPKGSIWLPAIVVEEQLRGRMSVLAGLNSKIEKDSQRVPAAYALLLKTVFDLNAFPHLAYTAEMEALYQSWPVAVKRLGTRDCRIGATAIVHGFTVITCNLSHFQPMPNVRLEDWSQ